jgi:Mg-chelatase subunit ChlD
MKKKKAKVVGKRTHVSIILDRTGSMQSIKDDIIGGFNTFLEEQRKSKNKITMSLVQFDDQAPHEVIYNMVPMAKVVDLTNQTYVPRGCTPLLDAMGRGISELDSQIKLMKPTVRPNKVVVVVITDGQENASREYKKEQIEKMIKDKQAKKWQFVFLSADLGSIGDSKSYGFSGAATMAYDHNALGTRNMFRSLSMNVGSYASGMTKCCSFTDDDRKQQANEKKVATKK